MKYSQGMDMNYLLEKQKRYKKLIKSYQINDISREYSQAKKVNENLTEKINQQTVVIEKLNNQLTNKENELQEIIAENKRLRNEFTNNSSSTTNNIIQQLQDTVTKELQRHLFLIYHLSDVLMMLDQNAANKEVFDIMDNFNTNKTEESQNPSNVAGESKEVSQGQFLSVIQRSENEVKPEIKENPVEKTAEIEPIQKPKQFYFKDLQSYKSAYLLPENNLKDEENDLKQNSIFNQKMKTIQKIKQNQLQKATSFNPRLNKEKEPLIKEKIPTEEKVETSPLITDKVETVQEETIENTINNDPIEKEVVPETETFLKKLWNKVKSLD
ncbi:MULTISPECIES: hypothetical protein [Paraliobacillus]|uniref:hypothetical protein n=1 Tax=Paraliobacillus TaxID=200903 RepID=UPI000DD330C5|nr:MULTISPECIES: hypothetical protein [Paraliobacillus]